MPKQKGFLGAKRKKESKRKNEVSKWGKVVQSYVVTDADCRFLNPRTSI